MERSLLLAFLCLFVTHCTMGQDLQKYSELVQEAERMYEAKGFYGSSAKYTAAFEALEGAKAEPRDLYNAACVFALTEDPETAFEHLFKLAIEHQYSNLKQLISEPDLGSLHGEDRWPDLMAIVAVNKEKAEENMDHDLVAVLAEIYEEDQGLRQQLGQVEEEYGRGSEELRAVWKLIGNKDSINMVKVAAILDTRGWLGADVIGEEGNSTLFLVVHHASLKDQVKYLPMMRKAADIGNAKASSLALLEDRVALRQGRRQVYGSQIARDNETGEFFVSPLVVPEKVNDRRAKVGLQPIEDYVSYWGIEWDVEKHKARTAKMESAPQK